MEILEINKPFYSAGKMYGFAGDYGMLGVGIRKELLFGEGSIKVRIVGSDQVYEIEKKKGRELALKYKAKFVAKSVVLCVLPLTAFNKI